MLKKFLVLLSLATLTTACSSGAKHAKNHVLSESDDAQLTQLISHVGKGNRIKHSIRTNRSSVVGDKQLAQIYSEWAGTRYRMGGTGKGGIDCSAFMQTTFLQVYGIELPRSTSEQRYLGTSVRRHELQKGDLVFFRSNRHVGVYIGNNQFMHASSRQGVTISSLDEEYWARTYTQARRVM